MGGREVFYKKQEKPRKSLYTKGHDPRLFFEKQGRPRSKFSKPGNLDISEKVEFHNEQQTHGTLFGYSHDSDFGLVECGQSFR